MEETIKREEIKKAQQIKEEKGQDTDNMRWKEIKG